MSRLPKTKFAAPSIAFAWATLATTAVACVDLGGLQGTDDDVDTRRTRDAAVEAQSADGASFGDGTAARDGESTSTLDGAAPDSSAPFDATTPDGSSADAQSDAVQDAGVDATQDATVEASTDAASDSAADVGLPPQRTQCGPSTTSSSGLGASADFFLGWRFNVPAGGMRVRRLGAGVSANSVQVTMFVAIVALTGPTDLPDVSNLSGTDLRSTSLIPIPANFAGEASVAVDLLLAPGWYGEFFGTGSYGASAGFVNLPTVQNMVCASGQAPVSIRQSDGNVFTATTAPHMFVDHD